MSHRYFSYVALRTPVSNLWRDRQRKSIVESPRLRFRSMLKAISIPPHNSILVLYPDPKPKSQEHFVLQSSPILSASLPILNIFRHLLYKGSCAIFRTWATHQLCTIRAPITINESICPRYGPGKPTIHIPTHNLYSDKFGMLCLH